MEQTSSSSRSASKGALALFRIAKSYGFLTVASLIFLGTVFILYLNRRHIIQGSCISTIGKVGGTLATPSPSAISDAIVHMHVAPSPCDQHRQRFRKKSIIDDDPRDLGALKPSVFPNEFWFVKTMKVGGTTLQGILNTICARYNIVYMGVPSSKNWLGWNISWGSQVISQYRSLPGFRHVAITDHGEFDPALADRLRNPLLFTAVRDPIDRAISHIFFFFRPGTGRKDLLTPTIKATNSSLQFPEELLQSITKVLQEEGLHDHLFRYIRGNKETPEEAVAQYDFIFVQERFQESLVVFAIEYGLSLIDIAHLSTKVRTGQYPSRKTLPSRLVKEISQVTKNDHKVYQLAVARLDKRIQELRSLHKKNNLINSPDFDGMLNNLRRLQIEIEAECSNFTAWHSTHGFSTGYFTHVVQENDADPGIGQRCLDYVSRKWLLKSVRQHLDGVCSSFND